MTLLSRSLALLVLPLVFVLMVRPADAHKIRIFAWPEGNIIHGETAFSGNRKPVNVEITVLDAATQTTLLTTRTDEQGKFSFTLPPEVLSRQPDLLLVVNTGEGHRGEWTMPAAEYLGSVDQPIAEKTQPPASTVTDTSPQQPSPTTGTDIVNTQQLRNIIDQELEKKLAPIRQLLAEQEDNGPSLRDIFAGLGYIFGLAGLFIWLQNRKKRSTEQ